MKKQLSIIVLTVLVALSGYFGLQSFGYAKKYESGELKLVMDKDVHNQAQYQIKALAEDLSLGYFENDKRLEREKIAQQNVVYREASLRTMLYAVGMAVVVLFAAYFLGGLRYLVLFGGAVSALLLFFGIFTPLLTLTIHKEVQYLGDVALSFESKSVLGSIGKLWGGGERVVAMTILLFSVLIPLVKVFSLMFVSIVLKSRFAHSIVRFFKIIGKWSMVDVFVVATLLVYMTGSNSDVTHAQIQTGLYFFLAYVLMSMALSLSADKMLQALKEEKGTLA